MTQTSSRGIITEELILRALSSTEGQDPPTSGALSLEDDGGISNMISLSKVQTLYFSFQRITRIENLCGLGKLIKLHLNNNEIDEIRGLDQLAQLKRLDLSFNNINQIEGLNKLDNLLELSLFHNQIQYVTGLNRCTKLESLSLGENCIDSMHDRDIGTGPQLCHLKMLKDLNLIGNPLKEKSLHNYHLDVLSYLPNLVYLDNVKIPVSLSREAKKSEEPSSIRTETHNLVGSVVVFDDHELKQVVQEMRNKILAQLRQEKDDTERTFTIKNNLEATDKRLTGIMKSYDKERDRLMNEFTAHRESFQAKLNTTSNDMIRNFGEMFQPNRRKLITEDNNNSNSNNNNKVRDEMMNSEINFASNIDTLVEDLKLGALSYITEMTQTCRDRSSKEFCETFHMLILAIEREACVTIDFTTTTTTNNITTEGTTGDDTECGADQDCGKKEETDVDERILFRQQRKNLVSTLNAGKKIIMQRLCQESESIGDHMNEQLKECIGLVYHRHQLRIQEICGLFGISKDDKTANDK